MSQQLQNRAYTRPKGDPALTQYTGQVMEIHAPQIGQNNKERPRGVRISDNPATFQGKLFRIWAWKEEDFNQLQPGAWVTVHYEVEPHNDPAKRGSNAISAVEPATAPGGGQAEGSSGVWGSTSNAPEAAAPQPTNTPPNQAWGEVKAELSKDDYWANKEATDHERTLEIESAWAIGKVLDNTTAELDDDALLQKALLLVILKRRLASELGHG